jgi:integrase/recombinase XerD
MTPLRQRFIDDLRLRNFSPKTVKAYVAGVLGFARHFGRSPANLGSEEIRSFQIYLLQQQASWSLYNQTVCALRFLYGVTLGRPDVVQTIPYGKRPKTLPSVLSPEEVTRLIEAARPGRQRVMVQTAYACGLRITELLHLRVADIDSARMVVIVRQGKGRKIACCHCRPACSRNCGRTGGSSAQRCGSFPACSRASRSAMARSTARFRNSSSERDSANA